MPARPPALKIAALCPLRWDEMVGDDRIRFCARCQQNVYDVAGLTQAELTRLSQSREGRLCLRLQVRPDGTVITKDCWHAVRRARARLVSSALALVAAASGFWGGVAVLRRRFTSLRRVPDHVRPTLPSGGAPASKRTLIELDGFELPSDSTGYSAGSYTQVVGQYSDD